MRERENVCQMLMRGLRTRTAWRLGQEAGREAGQRGHFRGGSDGRVRFGQFDYLNGGVGLDVRADQS